MIHKIMDFAMANGFDLCALEFSPIKGPEGNIEYLIHLKKCAGKTGINMGIDADTVVDQAFEELAK